MAALNLTNDIAQPPSDHQAKWAADCPCNEDGSIMQGLGPTSFTDGDRKTSGEMEFFVQAEAGGQIR
jgi:hypothetical protein